MSRSYHASCAIGLQHVLARELEALGAEHVNEHPGGCTFRGPAELGARAVLWLRSASRVTERLFGNRFAKTRELLYDAVRGFDWRGTLTPEQTFAVHASSNQSTLGDAHWVALVVKDAIVDSQSDVQGGRSDVDTDDPDVPIRVVLRRNKVSVHLDLAGESLHRRGWRPVQVKSPLNEAVAAGLLLHTGWTAEQSLYDPMCGSGTFLVEAAHLATDRAPGLERSPALLRYPNADPKVWNQLIEEARDRHAAGLAVHTEIAGSDAHGGATSIARSSLEGAQVSDRVEIDTVGIEDLRLETPPKMVVSNPPWGLRIGNEDHAASWKALGTFLKHQCTGATAWLLSGAPELTRALHLRNSERHPLRIGSVDARWLRYDMH